MTTAPLQPKRRKWLWRSLWTMLFLLLSSVGFWCFSYYSALAERDALIAELHAKGEPVWWQEVIERLEQESGPDTGAELFRQAMWEMGRPFNPSGFWLPSAALDAISAAKYEPGVFAEVEKELALTKRAIELAGMAAEKRPGFVLKELDVPEPFAVNIDISQSALHLVRMLRWRCFDSLGRGNESAAYASARLTFGCAEQFSNEPLLCMQHRRNHFALLGCSQLRMCLEYAMVPDAEFPLVDAALASLLDARDYDAALLGERGYRLAIFESDEGLASSLSALARLRVIRGDQDQWFAKRWHDAIASTLGRPARMRTQTEFLRLVERVRVHMRRVPVDLDAIQFDCREFLQKSPVHKLVGGSGEFEIEIDWLPNFAQTLAGFHRRLNFARLALRLRRHYDQHGRFPDSLDAVCDAAMPKIPLEWFGGRPIVYKQTAKGFRLELPEEIVPPEARHRLKESPIFSDWGLDLELKTLPPPKGAAK